MTLTPNFFVYSIVVPSMVLFSIPLAICASITTLLAFLVLGVRLGIVYVEMGMAILPSYFSSSTAESSYPTIHRIPSFRSTTSVSNFQISTVRRRKRLSVSSHGSHGSNPSTPPVPIHPSHSFDLSIPQSIGAERDYEGMGGWRLNSKPDEDESLWTRINSRLELPADGTRARRHQRALTSSDMPGHGDGEWRSVEVHYTPELCVGKAASANASRARTPPRDRDGILGEWAYVFSSAPHTSLALGMDGYFSQPVSPKCAKRSPPSGGSPVSLRSLGGVGIRSR